MKIGQVIIIIIQEFEFYWEPKLSFIKCSQNHVCAKACVFTRIMRLFCWSFIIRISSDLSTSKRHIEAAYRSGLSQNWQCIWSHFGIIQWFIYVILFSWYQVLSYPSRVDGMLRLSLNYFYLDHAYKCALSSVTNPNLDTQICWTPCWASQYLIGWWIILIYTTSRIYYDETL